MEGWKDNKYEFDRNLVIQKFVNNLINAIK